MTQEIKVTMTIEADVTKDKTDIEQSIRQKDFELISIDDIKEEREIYQSDDLPKVIETRVYVVDGINYEFDTTPEKWDEEVFMSEAEIQGTVYSLEGFQKAHNNSEIDLEDCYIRFINVKL
jgi:hypothetical protein